MDFFKKALKKASENRTGKLYFWAWTGRNRPGIAFSAANLRGISVSLPAALAQAETRTDRLRFGRRPV